MHPGLTSEFMTEMSAIVINNPPQISDMAFNGVNVKVLINHESLFEAVFQEIGQTGHVDPEGDDEDAAGLPVARERPGAGKHH